MKGAVKSVNNGMNLQDLVRQLLNHPSTLEDLGITEERGKQIMSAQRTGAKSSCYTLDSHRSESV